MCGRRRKKKIEEEVSHSKRGAFILKSGRAASTQLSNHTRFVFFARSDERWQEGRTARARFDKPWTRRGASVRYLSMVKAYLWLNDSGEMEGRRESYFFRLLPHHKPSEFHIHLKVIAVNFTWYCLFKAANRRSRNPEWTMSCWSRWRKEPRRH